MIDVDEVLKPVYAKLDDIKTWPDNWNSYNAPKPDLDAIERGREWITALYVFVAHETWIEPNATPDDEAICYEWFHGIRKITVYMDNGCYEALQIYDTNDAHCIMTDHAACTVEDCQALWRWLHGLEALDSTHKQLDQQAQQASEYGDTSYGACLLQSIEAARTWITVFYSDVARDTWLVPEICHNDAECAVFIWRHGLKKTLAVYIDSRGVEVLRQYNLSFVCKECNTGKEQYEEKDIDASNVEAMHTAWQWLHSPYRFAVGDTVKVVQWPDGYKSQYTGKQGVIAAHSVHSFTVPGYDVAIEGCSGLDGYPYVALSERSLTLAQQ